MTTAAKKRAHAVWELNVFDHVNNNNTHANEKRRNEQQGKHERSKNNNKIN